MIDFLAMAVRKPSHELLEVISTLFLRKWTSMSNKVKELTSLAKLKRNELLRLFNTPFLILRDSIINLFNHIWMV